MKHRSRKLCSEALSLLHFVPCLWSIWWGRTIVYQHRLLLFSHRASTDPIILHKHQTTSQFISAHSCSINRPLMSWLSVTWGHFLLCTTLSIHVVSCDIVNPSSGTTSNQCWLDTKEIYLLVETDQFIKKYEHCGAASYCCC